MMALRGVLVPTGDAFVSRELKNVAIIWLVSSWACFKEHCARDIAVV
jgi:hypothetical protein